MLISTLRPVRRDLDLASPTKSSAPEAHLLSQLYGSLETAAGIGSWQYNFKAKRLLWSKGIYNLLGVPEGTIPSHDLFARFTHPDDRLPMDNLDSYLRDVRTINREFRIVDANGTVRWIAHKAEVFVDAHGQQILAAGILIDISARMNAMQEREAAEKRLRVVWRSIASTTWTTEPNGNKPASQGWMDLTGQTVKEASGLGWLNAVYEPDRQATRDSWLKAYATKTRYVAKYRLICRDGVLRWFLAQAVPVLDAHGNIEQWLGALIDIDELGQKHSPPLDLSDFCGLSGHLMTAARALVGWSLNDLAKHSGVSVSTIRRIEEATTVTAKKPIMLKLVSVLREAGVEFRREDENGWFIGRSTKPGASMAQRNAPEADFRLPAR